MKTISIGGDWSFGGTTENGVSWSGDVHRMSIFGTVTTDKEGYCASDDREVGRDVSIETKVNITSEVLSGQVGTKVTRVREYSEGVTTPGAGESACDVWLGGAVCSGNWASTIEVGNCIFDSDISTV